MKTRALSGVLCPFGKSDLTASCNFRAASDFMIAFAILVASLRWLQPLDLQSPSLQVLASGKRDVVNWPWLKAIAIFV